MRSRKPTNKLEVAVFNINGQKVKNLRGTEVEVIRDVSFYSSRVSAGRYFLSGSMGVHGVAVSVVDPAKNTFSEVPVPMDAIGATFSHYIYV